MYCARRRLAGLSTKVATVESHTLHVRSPGDQESHASNDVSEKDICFYHASIDSATEILNQAGLGGHVPTGHGLLQYGTLFHVFDLILLITLAI